MPIVRFDFDENSKVPKYRLIKEHIVSSIVAGKLVADEQLPTEHELMQQFDVSRVTVRRALQELYDDGYIYRVQGKGTFCSRSDTILSSAEREGLKSSGYRKIVESHNKMHSRSFVSLSMEPCSQEDANMLEIEEGTPVYVLDRIHYVDGKPWVFVRGVMHPENAKGFEAFNPAHTSLFDIAYNNFGGVLDSRGKRISVVLTDEILARHLEAEEGFPLVKCDYVAFLLSDSGEKRFESAHAFYRTDVLSYLPEYA